MILQDAIKFIRRCGHLMPGDKRHAGRISIKREYWLSDQAIFIEGNVFKKVASDQLDSSMIKSEHVVLTPEDLLANDWELVTNSVCNFAAACELAAKGKRIYVHGRNVAKYGDDTPETHFLIYDELNGGSFRIENSEGRTIDLPYFDICMTNWCVDCDS